MNYTKVVFSCKGEEWQQDLLINDLASLGFETFEPTPEGFNAYIISGQFYQTQLTNLLEMLPSNFPVQYLINEIEHQNWNELWESNFEPIVIGNDCRVRATFHPHEEGYTYNLVIDPKMAFGTGHHQTTGLMMKYILEEDVAGKKVLDMGCGTGILTILAALKGASVLIGIDNDPVCYDSILENARLNKIENLEAYCGSVEKIPTCIKFDVILANINRNILLEQLPAYSEALKENGLLFLSGFYEGDDLKKIIEKCQLCGFTAEGNKEQDRWVAAKFIKRT
ncbi:ribosomal protein L11 methyltransferase [bacterium A37T11]|nr:ribosomal protein L11 methyltransferase [bacterium A37T11]